MQVKDLFDIIVNVGILGGLGVGGYFLYRIFGKRGSNNNTDRNGVDGNRNTGLNKEGSNGFTQHPAKPGIDSSELPQGVSPNEVDSIVKINTNSKKKWENENESAFEDIDD